MMRFSAFLGAIFPRARRAREIWNDQYLRIVSLSRELEKAKTDIMLLAGQAAARATPAKIASIHEAEFHAFSQFGEDGIIQYLIRALGDRLNKSFVEFGVQGYLESNTLFLLMSNGWRGLVMDGERQYIESINARDLRWKYGLQTRCAFVSRENINDIFREEGFGGDLGLLSIDVDGIDWHLWNALTITKPGIVVCEYNPHFPVDRPVTVPYAPMFDRMGHPSTIYYGTSLSALCILAAKKGYAFVGTESHKRNAFFVRSDLADAVPSDTPRQEHTHGNGEKTRAALAGMPFYNVVTGSEEPL